MLLFGLLFRIFLDVFLLAYIDQLRQMEAPRNVVRGDESLVIDSIKRERQEVEKLLKRKKELILREEEEEVQHPQKELSALDRLNLQTSYQMEFLNQHECQGSQIRTGENRRQLRNTRK